MKPHRMVELAGQDDIGPWLALALEVEPLFGPLIATGFEQRLRTNIGRRSAFCIRAGKDGVLPAGVIFDSREAPIYQVTWLAVAERYRGQGFGRSLLEYCLSVSAPTCIVRVVTFGPTVSGGAAARGLYIAFGFQPEDEFAEPDGGSRQEFVLTRTAGDA